MSDIFVIYHKYITNITNITQIYHKYFFYSTCIHQLGCCISHVLYLRYLWLICVLSQLLFEQTQTVRTYFSFCLHTLFDIFHCMYSVQCHHRLCDPPSNLSLAVPYYASPKFDYFCSNFACLCFSCCVVYFCRCYQLFTE